MSDNTRAFHTERFLDKFEGREDLLLTFLRRWEGRLDLGSLGETPDVQTFKDWLRAGQGGVWDELTDTILQIYDLCCVDGRECLFQVLREARDFDPGPEERMPMACLSLKVWLERPDLFRVAYQRHAAQPESPFAIYLGAPASEKCDTEDAAGGPPEHEITNPIGERVRLRPYELQDFKDLLNFHEAHVTTELQLRGGGGSTPVAATLVRRSAPPDCDSCQRASGQPPNETARVETAGGVDLTCLADPEFAMPVDGPDRAFLTEVHFRCGAAGDLDRAKVSFVIHGRDVLPMLHAHSRRQSMDPSTVRRAVFKFYPAGSRRGRPVTVTGPDKIVFGHGAHPADTRRYLQQWGVIK